MREGGPRLIPDRPDRYQAGSGPLRVLLWGDEVGRDLKAGKTGEATAERAPRRASRGAFFERCMVANEGQKAGRSRATDRLKRAGPDGAAMGVRARTRGPARRLPRLRLRCEASRGRAEPRTNRPLRSRLVEVAAQLP